MNICGLTWPRGHSFEILTTSDLAQPCHLLNGASAFFSPYSVCSRPVSHTAQMCLTRSLECRWFAFLSTWNWRRQWHPHSSTLAWKIPWTKEPGRLQSMGSLTVGHDWATSLSLFIFMHWRRKWQPTPVFLPEESQGRGSLVGCRLWGRTESDTTEAT